MSIPRQYNQATFPWDRESMIITRKEWFLIITTFLAALLLNVSVINHSIGLVLLGFLCVFSLSSPLSALIAISTSQIVADPAGSPLTLVQCFFVAWAYHFFATRHVDYKALRKLVVWALPYIIATKIMNFVKWDAVEFIEYFDLAVLVGVMAAWYVGQLRGRFILGLMCIAIGASTSVITYWLSIAGIPIEGIVQAKGGGTVAGIGIGRGDGNFTGISISLAAISLLAWGLLTNIRLFESRRLNNIIVPYACVGFFLVSIPSTFATMSRGAVVTFFGGLVFVVLSSLYVSSLARGNKIICGLIVCTLGVLSINDDGGLISKYAGSMKQYSEKQMRDSTMMSRSGTWGGAWQEILNSPIIGTTPDTQVAVKGFGYEYNAHNVWLDVGRGTGVLGMVWFTAFFFYPISRLVRFLPRSEALLYCSPFVVLFFVFMNLSLINYKIFYLLWVLAVAAAHDGAYVQRSQTAYIRL